MSRGLGRLCLFFNQFLPVALQLALQVFESADRQAYACMNHITGSPCACRSVKNTRLARAKVNTISAGWPALKGTEAQSDHAPHERDPSDASALIRFPLETTKFSAN